MEIKTKYNVGDEVLIISNDAIIMDVVHAIRIYCHGTTPIRTAEITYQFLSRKMGSPNVIEKPEREVFSTPEELLEYYTMEDMGP